MDDDRPSAVETTVDVYTALDTIRDVVVFTGSRPTQWEYVSPAFEEFYDLPREAVRGDATRILEHVHPEDREQVAAVFDELAEDPTETQFDHRIRTTDETDRWVRVHLAPVEPESGEPPGIAGVITDITEQKRREEQLVILHRLLQHDIRNDMAVITGWLGVLAEQTQGTQEIIGRIQTASQQVLDLTEDTRQIVRASAGDESSQLHPTPIKPMVEAIVEEKQELYPDVDVVLEQPMPEVAVEANALLSTVFRNLVANAINHNDTDEPRVTLSVAERDETALITVSDNGPGVQEAQRETLFRMGEKGLRSSGTGLGLYLCRQIVESFDGEIWYEPTEGRGAVFHVELPLVE